MKKNTNDPNVWIIEQSENRVVYESTDGDIWEILGTCNMCGQCEVGDENIVFTGIPIGDPGACVDLRGGPETRGDNPVRPELTKDLDKCVLTGNYLNGN